MKYILILLILLSSTTIISAGPFDLGKIKKDIEKSAKTTLQTEVVVEKLAQALKLNKKQKKKLTKMLKKQDISKMDYRTFLSKNTDKISKLLKPKQRIKFAKYLKKLKG